MFSWRNKKDISIFRMKKAPYLLLCFILLTADISLLCRWNSGGSWSPNATIRFLCSLELTILSSKLIGLFLFASFLNYKILLVFILHLTLVLLNLDIPSLCKQCRSRSVGCYRSQMICICTVCHSVSELISSSELSQRIG